MKRKLALLGGSPVLKAPLPEPHYIGKEEIDAALQALKSGRLSGFVAKNNEEFLGGPWVRELERRFCGYFGSKFAVSVNSATSGLYAAVYSLGITSGDEVLVTPYTMSASVTAILSVGAVPVFVDVDKDNFCIDPAKIESNITAKTKAIMVVHLFGNSAEMDKIISVAKKYNLGVIEDCAQAPGALFKGKLAGRFGDIGVLSLNRHKTIQCGEGGVLVTDNPALALKLQLIRNHGEDVLDQMADSASFNLIGWNYKMTELQAAVAAAQIRKLDTLNSIRIDNAGYLCRKLAKFEWLRFNSPLPNTKSVYYRFVFCLDDGKLGISRSLFARTMQAEGFPLNQGYLKPVYLQGIYWNKKSGNDPYLAGIYNSKRIYRQGLCPVAENLYRKRLLLSNITNAAKNTDELDCFVLAIEKISGNIRELISYEKKN